MGKKFVFGIDLGTTYSCIAYIDETGHPVVVKNSEGELTTPSVVNFADPKHVVVGEVAKDNAVSDPENTVSMVKRLMGKTDVAFVYNGEKKSPEEVSSYILRKLVGDAAKMLDTEVKDVVITCPAYFGTAERTATKNAGEIAGLNVMEIISEPTAAALCYGCNKEQEDKTILVYDLGGGTFDVTVMRIGAGNIEVVCSDGNHELGGKDWDDALYKYLLKEFEEKTDTEPELEPDEQQELWLNVEKAKKQLTSKDKTTVTVQTGGERARIEVTRDIFDSITKTLLSATLNKTDSVIEKAKEKGFEIDEIILVGGSTRMPQVTAVLQQKYSKPIKLMDPDEAVAKGAAYYALGVYEGKVNELKEKVAAGEIDSKDKAAQEELAKYQEEAAVSTKIIPALGGKTMKEVVTVATTKSYGIATYINYEDYKCLNMIFKNVKMENGKIRSAGKFGTKEDFQTCVNIDVYESDIEDETYDVVDDFKLGTASLPLPGNQPAGSPLEIILELNNEGILEVTGRDLKTGKEIHATMQASKGQILSNKDVASIKAKSSAISVE